MDKKILSIFHGYIVHGYVVNVENPMKKHIVGYVVTSVVMTVKMVGEKVCIEEKDSDLYFIMKSSSDDADKPEWHFLKSSKKGWF